MQIVRRPSGYGVLLTAVKVSDDGRRVTAFAQDTAALFRITPQYYFLILVGFAIAAETIILGYLGRKRLGKIRRCLGKIRGPRKSRGQGEDPSSPFDGPSGPSALHTQEILLSRRRGVAITIGSMRSECLRDPA